MGCVRVFDQHAGERTPVILSPEVRPLPARSTRALEMTPPHFESTFAGLTPPSVCQPICSSGLDRAELTAVSIHLEVRHGY
jgi:hypothetical protein